MRYLPIVLLAFLVGCSGIPTTNPDGTPLTEEQQLNAKLELGLQSANRGLAALDLLVIIKSDEWSPEKVESWTLALATARHTLTELEVKFADGTLTYAEIEAAAFDVLIADMKRRAEANQDPPAEE